MKVEGATDRFPLTDGPAGDALRGVGADSDSLFRFYAGDHTDGSEDHHSDTESSRRASRPTPKSFVLLFYFWSLVFVLTIPCHPSAGACVHCKSLKVSSSNPLATQSSI